MCERAGEKERNREAGNKRLADIQMDKRKATDNHLIFFCFTIFFENLFLIVVFPSLNSNKIMNLVKLGFLKKTFSITERTREIPSNIFLP